MLNSKILREGIKFDGSEKAYSVKDFNKVLATSFNIEEVIDWLNSKINEESRIYGASRSGDYMIRLAPYKNFVLKVFRTMFYNMPEDMQGLVMKLSEKELFPETYQQGAGEAYKKSVGQINDEHIAKVSSIMKMFEIEYYNHFEEIHSLAESINQDTSKELNYEFANYVFLTYVSNIKNYISEFIESIKTIRSYSGKTFNSTIKGKIINLYGYFNVNTFYSLYSEYNKLIAQKNFKPASQGQQISDVINFNNPMNTIDVNQSRDQINRSGYNDTNVGIRTDFSAGKA